MTILLLLASVAFADPPATVFVEEGHEATAVGPSFIVHEVRMDDLLAKAKSAEELEERVRELVTKSTEEIDALTEQLRKARELRDKDAELIIQAQTREAEWLTKERRLKNQRNMAVGVTAALVAGMAVAWKVSP